VTSRLRSPDQSKHDSTCPASTDTLGPRATDPAGAPNSPSSRAAVARICSSQPVPGHHPVGGPLGREPGQGVRAPCPASAQGVGGEVGPAAQRREPVTVGEQLVGHGHLLGSARGHASAVAGKVRPVVVVGPLAARCGRRIRRVAVRSPSSSCRHRSVPSEPCCPSGVRPVTGVEPSVRLRGIAQAQCFSRCTRSSRQTSWRPASAAWSRLLPQIPGTAPADPAPLLMLERG
jgi:hypothetical protein